MSKGTTIDGHRLRRQREKRELTQGELAYLAGVDQSMISRLESGAATDLRLATATKLADALGVSLLSLLVGGKDDEPYSELPEFHTYISRKFEDNPRLQRSLALVYEAFEAAERELQEKRRERKRRERSDPQPKPR